MKNISKPVVCLDIGSYAIKVVELSRSKEGTHVERAAILPVTSLSNESVSKVLRALFDKWSPLPRHLRISVKGPSLLVRRIQLPKMTPGELKSAIRFEAEGQIPFSIEDCILDFQILNEVSQENKINVLLVAAKKDFIQQKLDLLAELGLKPEVIDLDVFCLVNAFGILGGEDSSGTYGLLNIGHQISSFAIIHEKLPLFIREIPYGGFQVTKALAELKGISETAADEMKLVALPQHLEDIRSATQKGFESLLEELKHSIDFFENDTGVNLKTIWMGGGGALAAGASEELSKELERQVSLWNGATKMSALEDTTAELLKTNAYQFDVVLGLALRGTAD